jgi:hypothetical protein
MSTTLTLMGSILLGGGAAAWIGRQWRARRRPQEPLGPAWAGTALGAAMGVGATLLLVPLLPAGPSPRGGAGGPALLPSTRPPVEAPRPGILPAVSNRSTASSAPTDVAAAHGAAAPLPEGEAVALERLRKQLEANPEDLTARRELAVRLTENGLFVEAFEEATALVAANPQDVDGLYVQGEVRLAMGQWGRAADLLDQVLAGHPDHLLALIARGKAYSQMGQKDAAVATLEKARELAGGRYPPIDALLAEIRGVAAPAAAPMPNREALQAIVAAAQAGTAGPGFDVRIELGPGVTAAPGATLFVALRTGAGGPPAAVKKVAAPRFPLDLTLGPGDTMMGGALPEGGTLTARLDADGDASTQEPEDLAASGTAEAGRATKLTLARNRP